VIRGSDIGDRLARVPWTLATSAFRRPLKGDTPDDPDLALRTWLSLDVNKHARWGYRRAIVAARDRGWAVNRRNIRFLFGHEVLRVVVRRRQKSVGVSDQPTITRAESPGDVRAIDVPFDSTLPGKPLKILSIVDERTRQALGGRVDY